MKKADSILISTHIYKGIGKDTVSGFIAVRGDRIQHIGGLETLERFIGPNTDIMNFGNQLIIPGFHDAHLHAFMSALYDEPTVAVSLTDTSEEQCVTHLTEIADKVPESAWLICAGWYHPLWEKPVLPTKASLDIIYPNRPVCMVSGDCHTIWLNSCGMHILGINENTEAPTGGVIDKDENGELLGTFHESAAAAIFQSVFDFPLERITAFYENFHQKLSCHGITSICDMSMMSIPGLDFIRDDVYEHLEEENKLAVRVHMYPTMLEGMERPFRLRDKFQGPMIYCNGVKHFFDGVSSCHTAYLKEPYTDAYYPGDVGKTTIEPGYMRKLVLEAHKNDFSMRVHTIGDQAIHLMLDYFQDAEATYGYKPYIQHTLEHLENFQYDDISRLAGAHVIPSVQPPHLTIDPLGVKRILGHDRNKLMWPFRSELDAGCTLAFGTDSPVVGINPFHVIYSAVTRKSYSGEEQASGWFPEERISPWEALSAYTYGSACAANSQSLYGSLAAGKFADICVLDHNILEGDPERILKTSCVMTMLGGMIVYEK